MVACSVTDGAATKGSVTKRAPSRPIPSVNSLKDPYFVDTHQSAGRGTSQSEKRNPGRLTAKRAVGAVFGRVQKSA